MFLLFFKSLPEDLNFCFTLLSYLSRKHDINLGLLVVKTFFFSDVRHLFLFSNDKKKKKKKFHALKNYNLIIKMTLSFKLQKKKKKKLFLMIKLFSFVVEIAIEFLGF